MPEYKLSDAELYIMRCFWAHGPMGTDVLSRLVQPRGWKPTTLLTFLSRLCQKGMLGVEKQGKSNLYRPLVTGEAYARDESRVLLDELYGGSVQKFLAAMVNSRSVSPQDLTELKAWLEAQPTGEGSEND